MFGTNENQDSRATSYICSYNMQSSYYFMWAQSNLWAFNPTELWLPTFGIVSSSKAFKPFLILFHSNWSIAGSNDYHCLRIRGHLFVACWRGRSLFLLFICGKWSLYIINEYLRQFLHRWVHWGYGLWWIGQRTDTFSLSPWFFSSVIRYVGFC